MDMNETNGTLLGPRPDQGWIVNEREVDMTRPPRPVRRMAVAAEPQNIVIDAGKAAFLVVDMQNDFCTPGGWMDACGIDISPNRAPIEPIARTVAACRGHGVPVVWVNWGVRKDLLNISPSLRHAHNPRGNAPGLAEPVPGTRSEILREESWGAEVVDEINPGEADHHVNKHRFSGFWDTDLDAILRNLGVRTLLIGGVNLDQCVMTTLEDASFLGYDTILVRDCAATTSPDYCTRATLYNIKLLFGFVTESDAVIRGLVAA